MSIKKDTHLRISGTGRCDTSGERVKKDTFANPEIQKSDNSSISHANPLFNRQKPFLAQVKSKIPNGEKEASSFYYSRAQDQSDGGASGLKSSSFAVERNEKNKSKYDYLLYAQRQHQLEKEASKELPKQTSNELYKQPSKELSSKDSLPTPYRISLSATSYEELTAIKQENRALKERLSKLQEDLAHQIQTSNHKERQIYQRNQVIEDLMTEIQKSRSVMLAYNKLQNSFNLLLMENQRLKQTQDYCSEINSKYVQVVNHCEKLELILNQKDQFLHETLSNRENSYNSAMQSKNGQIRSLEHRIAILQQENERLIREIEVYARNKGKETDIDEFQKFSIEFQIKINAISDENARLKNIISQSQGKIQQLNMQNSSLQKIIKAFEDRDSINTDSKLESELEYYKQRLQREQQENDRQKSDYELQILKLQNELDTRKFQQTGSLLDFTDRERILENMVTLIAQNEKLKKKVSQYH